MIKRRAGLRKEFQEWDKSSDEALYEFENSLIDTDTILTPKFLEDFLRFTQKQPS